MLPPTPAEEKLAAQLAGEAIAGFASTLPPEDLEDLREQLLVELLFTTAGRAKLRQLLPPPVVYESEEIVRVPSDAKKKGGAAG